MALMTSCPACNTRFKVVPDQLRLHHGLVRCGACDHVFDAHDRLESLPEAPIQVSIEMHLKGGFYDTDEQSQGWIHKPAVVALTDDPATDGLPSQDWTQLLPEQSTLLSDPALDTSVQTHSPALAPRRKRIRPDLSGSTAIITSQNTGDEIVLNEASAVFESQGEPSDTEAAKQIERRRRRAAKKRKAELEHAKKTLLENKKTAVRSRPRININGSKIASVAGLTLCFFALCTAGLQTAIAARFVLADRISAVKPVLSQLCASLSCTLEPATWLSPLALDALSLSKANTAANNAESLPYRMQATVRNTSQLTVKNPNIELTISNAQGNPIARKTLTAQQLGAIATLSPNSDWQIDTALQLDSQTVGYTARLVY